jgi:outer membrane protein OmpA-like peptidoglycan-associated protein/ABC-type amino acid transport substrate-binding protein
MSKNVVVFLVFVVVGSLAILGYYFAKPFLNKQEQVDISDAGRAQGSVSIGIDNWVGYIPLCSKEMRQRMHQSGLLLQCQVDEANYSERFKKIKMGELDFAVATVDAFILNGAEHDFPGSIIMVIDESKGGDALLARKDKIQSLEELKTKTGWRIAFTPNSPSEHLLKSFGKHFDIPALRQRKGLWRVEVNGSNEARKKLENGEVDAAVLWEPDVSKVLASSEMIKLLGTEDTRNLIVDVLIVNRQFAKSHPDWVKKLLSHYFYVLKYYRDNPSSLVEEIATQSKLDESQVNSMLKGVRWINLVENAKTWFGLNVQGKGQESLLNTIETTTEILMANQDFKENPIPDGDYYRLQYRNFIEELIQENLALDSASKSDNLEVKKFSELSEEQWAALTEVGSLKIRPIGFQSGTSELNETGKTEIDQAIQDLLHYPNFRILINGHSGLKGEASANKILSLQRAEAVKKYLSEKHFLVKDRLHSKGLGSEMPLAREIDESERAYEYRLPRVEIKLLAETL